jgi:hypothetical protein
MSLRIRTLRRPRVLVPLALALAAACAGSLATDPGASLSPTRLRYRLDARWTIFFCDPDYYPIARADELQRALEVYPSIAADTEKLNAILEHLALPAQPVPSDSTKLSVYRESKRLSTITLSAAGNSYTFQLREAEAKGSVFSVSGRIDPFGLISVASRTPSYGGCPICLDGDVRIATPAGTMPVRTLVAGDSVWTRDSSGRRVVVPVLRVGHVPVPPEHRMVQLGLSDGRALRVSPGHPTAGGRLAGELMPGDTLDGARVIRTRRVPPRGGATYDILPAGPTGVYWANGIALRSTLAGAGAQAPIAVAARRAARR